MNSLVEARAVVHAIEFALENGGFKEKRDLKRAAQELLRDLRSPQSRAGKLLQALEVLRGGATIEQLMRATGASRRSIFRYLNLLEEAGIELTVSEGVYTAK